MGDLEKLKEETMTRVLNDLHTSEIPFVSTRAFSRRWEDRPGLYVIKDKGVPIYIGESKTLRRRICDLTDSRHHSFRKNLCKNLFSEVEGYDWISNSYKFPPHIEDLLNDYMNQNLTISTSYIDFGRSEIEVLLIEKYENKNLYNKISRRQK